MLKACKNKLFSAFILSLVLWSCGGAPRNDESVLNNEVATNNARTTITTSYSLDMSFNSLGYNTNKNAAGGSGTDSGAGIAIDSSNRILIGGSSANGVVGASLDMAAWRYTAAGALDTDFSSDGVYTHNDASGGAWDYANDMVVDSSDRMIVVGTENAGGNNMAVWRFKTDGTLDTDFGGGDGIYLSQPGGGASGARAAVIDSQGRIVVVGSDRNGNDDFAIWRLTSTGTLDVTFSTAGVAGYDIQDISGGNADYGWNVAVDDSDNIFVVGETNNGADLDIFIMKYDSDGVLDTTFDTDGIVTYDGGSGDDAGLSITIDSSGDPIITGHSSNGVDPDLILIKYLSSDGSLDTSFGTSGIVTYASGNGDDRGYDLTIYNSEIYVTGYAHNGSDVDMVILNYSLSGVLDTTFGSDGVLTHHNAAGGDGADAGNDIVFDSSGSIYVSGTSTNSDGNYDMAVWKYKLQ
jgi:uncharacterized delta-60 repeat protein